MPELTAKRLAQLISQAVDRLTTAVKNMLLSVVPLMSENCVHSFVERADTFMVGGVKALPVLVTVKAMLWVFVC